MDKPTLFIITILVAVIIVLLSLLIQFVGWLLAFEGLISGLCFGLATIGIQYLVYRMVNH